jgi:Na+/proline symporter
MAATSCIVYNRGEAPDVETVLGEWVGWIVVIGFGLFFTFFSVFLTKLEQNTLGTTMSSEQFNTAGRSIGAGLTAAVIVSQWTWAATLLMSSNMGWRVGLSGPFWYASGATIQILLFAVLAIQVKRRASHMHTFMEIVKARFGTVTHIIMICFALMANMIVTAMLLLGGAATIADLTGMSKIWASFLIPILSCWIYTMHGGLKATFFASYVHTTVIFLMLLIFTFTVYAGSGDSSELYGTPDRVYKGLEKASVYAFTTATQKEADYAKAKDFSALNSYIENAGTCYSMKSGTPSSTGKSCSFSKRGLDEACCSASQQSKFGKTVTKYCRSNTTDCIDLSKTEHFESKDCDYKNGESCVTSLATMSSPSGLLFGITNIVGNFGTVFVDQSYWQSAVAAKPKSAVLGFLIGGMVWFAVPFCMATTNGIVGRALTTHPDLTPLYITGEASGSGLTPARALAHILGKGGAFILLLQLFMAITSTGSAEIIAVSSILTYDIYYEYINPELKTRRENLRRIFYSCVEGPLSEGIGSSGQVAIGAINGLMEKLSANNFFEKEVPTTEVAALATAIGAFAVDGQIATADLYAAVNRAVSSNSLEGIILLRVSKFGTAIFAIFMGFLAVFLQTLGFSLGWVYMSMGVIIGRAVGPASLTILMERANSIAIAAGAVGGLILGLMGWCIKASVDNDGKVEYDTLGQDWPWVVGNLCAILGGLGISLVGSLIKPDTEFRWHMLNERIPLVDDIEPPKDADETDEKLQKQVKIAIGASIGLTFVLLVLWPIPMHTSGGVFSSGGFTTWVALEMIWALIGGIVIITLPLYETIKAFLDAKKAKAARADKPTNESCELPDSSTLRIPSPKGGLTDEGTKV